jgi:hypothetical protein
MGASDIARITATIPTGLSSAAGFTFDMLELNADAVTINDANLTFAMLHLDASASTYTAGTAYGVHIEVPDDYASAIEVTGTGANFTMNANVDCIDINLENAAFVNASAIDIDAGDITGGNLIDINYTQASTIGAGLTHNTILVTGANVTCGAGETYNGILLDATGIGTGGTITGMVTTDGTNYGQMFYLDAAAGYALRGAGAAGEVGIFGVGTNTDMIDIDLDVKSGGNVISVQYTTAEQLETDMSIIDIDMGTNVTSGQAGDDLAGLHINVGDITWDAAMTGIVRGIWLEMDPAMTDENIYGIQITMPGTYGTGTQYALTASGAGATINLLADGPASQYVEKVYSLSTDTPIEIPHLEEYQMTYYDDFLDSAAALAASLAAYYWTETQAANGTIDIVAALHGTMVVDTGALANGWAQMQWNAANFEGGKLKGMQVRFSLSNITNCTMFIGWSIAGDISAPANDLFCLHFDTATDAANLYAASNNAGGGEQNDDTGCDLVAGQWYVAEITMDTTTITLTVFDETADTLYTTTISNCTARDLDTFLPTIHQDNKAAAEQKQLSIDFIKIYQDRL